MTRDTDGLRATRAGGIGCPIPDRYTTQHPHDVARTTLGDQCAVWLISAAQRSRIGRTSAEGAEGSIVTTLAMPWSR